MNTREKLLDAAETGMRELGYHGLSFRDLAEELGIKSSSVHYHFRAKEDLGLALVKRYSEHFFEALNEEFRKTGEPIDAMVEIYGRSLSSSDALCLCGMLGAEIQSLPPVVAVAVGEYLAENVEWLANRLTTIDSVGRPVIASHVVSTLQGAMMIANALDDREYFDRATETLATLQS